MRFVVQVLERERLMTSSGLGVSVRRPFGPSAPTSLEENPFVILLSGLIALPPRSTTWSDIPVRSHVSFVPRQSPAFLNIRSSFSITTPRIISCVLSDIIRTDLGVSVADQKDAILPRPLGGEKSLVRPRDQVLASRGVPWETGQAPTDCQLTDAGRSETRKLLRLQSGRESPQDRQCTTGVL